MNGDDEYFGEGFHDKGKPNFGHKSDAVFLYVLITFQIFVTIFGLYKFFRKACGSAEY